MRSQVIVIMPCFNEEKNLSETCHSLGFGKGATGPGLVELLIIVDNNSTDETYQIAREIELLSPKNQVFIITEKEQGFVPARRAGNEFAKSWCKKNGVRAEDTLILQVDADTIYPDGYAATMQAAAEQYGKNCIVEACIDYRDEFRQNFPGYIGLLEQTDAKYERIYTDVHDYIVDDKVVGYWLSDYIYWGGHVREFMADGSEIFAETTRLFLKALATGAVKRNVATLKAFHSERKVTQNPSMHFATAGFPREITWDNNWLEKHHLDQLQDIQKATFTEAISFRVLHLIALFYMLPAQVDRALGKRTSSGKNQMLNSLDRLMPVRTAGELIDRPGLFLSDAFSAIDNHGDLIRERVDNYLQGHD